MVEYGELRATLSAQNTLSANVQPGTGGGGTTDYELLENKPQINDVELIGNKSLPELGIVNNVQADWNETDSTAEDFIKNKPSIPTKTSDLDNNSNFVSDAAYVHTDNNYTTEEKEKLEDIQEGAEVNVQADWDETNMLSDSYIQNKPAIPTVNNNTITVQKNGQNVDSFTLNQNTDKNINITVPTKTSDIQNDSGFIQNTVNNLANYYLKSETYTQAEVQALINSAVNGRFEKVTVLPETGERNVIYLVPKNPAQTNNSYDEYIWQDNAWELLGSTDIDLSGYVTTTALTEALQNYVTTSALNTLIANYYTKTEVGTLLDRKVDKETGKGLSANDYSAEEKSKVSTAYDHSQDASRVASAIATGLYKVGATAQGHISELSAVVKADLTGLGVADNDDVTALDGRVDTIESETDNNDITVSGNPLSFTTESAQLASDCDITLNPIQDLHGYSKPWVGGAGKNLLPMTVARLKSENTVGTWNGNVFTSDYGGTTVEIITDADENIIGLKATAGDTQIDFRIFGAYGSTDVAIPSGRYTMALDSQNTSVNIFGGYGYDVLISSASPSIKTVTLNDGLSFVWLRIPANAVTNVTFQPLLMDATYTDETFEPYTNLCPISGRASVDLVGCGKNIWDEEWENGKINQDTGADISDNNCIRNKGFIDVRGLSSLYASFLRPSGVHARLVVHFYDANKNYLPPRLILDGSNNNFDIPNNAPYIHFYITDEYGATYNNDISINYPSTDTSYHAYQESNNITFTFGETVYGGTIDVRSGVVTVDWIKKSISKTDIIGEYLDTSTNQYLAKYEPIEAPKQTGDIYVRGNAITNLIENVSQSALFNSVGNLICIMSTANRFRLTFANCDTFEKMQDWLDANALEVCYELATPYTIQLTPHEVALLTGVNTITTDGDSITITYKDGKFATREDLVRLYEGIKAYIDYVTQ